MKYVTTEGKELDVYTISSVEERDHSTVTLNINRPASDNKHVIGRDAYNAHRPSVGDSLVIDAEGGVSIVAKKDAHILGTPVKESTKVETEASPAIGGVSTDATVTSPVKAEAATGTESQAGSSTEESGEKKSALPSDEENASETEESESPSSPQKSPKPKK